MPEPKILLFDIETAPVIAYTWGLFSEVTHPKFIRRNWFVLCWSAKWLGEKEVMNSSLPDYRGYTQLPSRTEKNIDKEVMKKLWELLDECDVAIAHNLKSFDRKKANTRFLIHGFPPPSPYQMVDTLTVARSQFKFTSNKLEYLADKLCVEKKMDAGGFDLWLGCEEGDPKCWKKMVKYCDQDVRSLEEVYLMERPYISNHPNLSVISNNISCPKCGSKQVVKNGHLYLSTGVQQRYQCRGCGGMIKGKLEKEERKKIVKNKLKNG